MPKQLRFLRLVFTTCRLSLSFFVRCFLVNVSLTSPELTALRTALFEAQKKPEKIQQHELLSKKLAVCCAVHANSVVIPFH